MDWLDDAFMGLLFTVVPRRLFILPIERPVHTQLPLQHCGPIRVPRARQVSATPSPTRHLCSIAFHQKLMGRISFGRCFRRCARIDAERSMLADNYNEIGDRYLFDGPLYTLRLESEC